MATSSRSRRKLGMLRGGPAGGRSNTHYRPADDFARSQLVEVFVDLIETDGLNRVLDLAFGGEGHDLAEVRIVAPERSVKCLRARYPRKERNINAIADETDIGIVTADRQQREAQLHHLRRAGAVDDRVELGLAGGRLEFLADIACGLTPDVDDIVATVLLSHRKLL